MTMTATPIIAAAVSATLVAKNFPQRVNILAFRGDHHFLGRDVKCNNLLYERVEGVQERRQTNQRYDHSGNHSGSYRPVD